MKQVSSLGISMSCLLFILLTSSCKKDSLNATPPPCDTCNTTVLKSVFINAGNWIKQDDGSYSCDITSELKQSGVSVNKVYAMYIADGTPFPQIYPETSGEYLGGSVLVTVNLSKDEGTCTLIFEFSSEEHFGEVRPGGLLPFGSIEIEACFL